MKICKTIFKEIKKHNFIIIARHIGPDPDALASTIALRDTILNTFPSKHVYAIGNPASKFKFIGILDKIPDVIPDDCLLIVTDTPDKKRIDGVDPSNFKHCIKIDHHPFVEKLSDLEWIDDDASSTCQMIIE
ncbi:MAG: DHH family phosphoesterase, partial [Erysipelotrichaceae bacterium]